MQFCRTCCKPWTCDERHKTRLTNERSRCRINFLFLNRSWKSAAAYGGGPCARRKGRSLCTVRKAADPLPNTRLIGHSSWCRSALRINRPAWVTATARATTVQAGPARLADSSRLWEISPGLFGCNEARQHLRYALVAAASPIIWKAG